MKLKEWRKEAIFPRNVYTVWEQKIRKLSQSSVSARDACDNVCFVTVALQIKLYWIELHQKWRHNKQELISDYLYLKRNRWRNSIFSQIMT